MNARQLRAWRRRQGCTFETKRGTGHIIVRRGDMMTVLPVHGGNKQMGKGLIVKIMRQLGLRGRPPN